MNVAMDLCCGDHQDASSIILACDHSDGRIELLDLDNLQQVTKRSKSYLTYSVSYFANRFYEEFLKDHSVKENLSIVWNKIRNCDCEVNKSNENEIGKLTTEQTSKLEMTTIEVSKPLEYLTGQDRFIAQGLVGKYGCDE